MKNNKSRPRDVAAAGQGASVAPVLTNKASWWHACWPWLLCLGLAAWLALSQLHALQNADSLVVSLISFLAWTPFYWRANRYGMFWALLCSNIEHPLHNVVAMMFCNVAGCLAAHFLLARLLWRERGPWQWSGLISVLLTFALSSPRFLLGTLTPYQFTTTPLALGCAGLGWLAGRRLCSLPICGALVAFFLLAWCNPAVPVMLGALLFWSLVLSWVDKPQSAGQGAWARTKLNPRDMLQFAFTGASLLLGMYMMRSSRWHDPAFDRSLPLGEWLTSASIMTQKLVWRSGDEQGAPNLVAAVGVLALGVFAAASISRQRAAWQAARRMAAGLLAALTYGILISGRGWAPHEGHNGRYFFPVLFVAVTAVSVGLVGAIDSLVRGRQGGPCAVPPAQECYDHLVAPAPFLGRGGRLGGAGALLSLAFIVGLRFGPPSYARVEAWLTRWAGETGEELLTSGATHVAGSYWEAWPSMFYANWQRYIHHDSRRVFAIAHRYDVTVPLWPADPTTWRIGLLKASMNEARNYVFGGGLREVELVKETPHLVLVRPRRPASSPSK